MRRNPTHGGLYRPATGSAALATALLCTALLFGPTPAAAQSGAVQPTDADNGAAGKSDERQAKIRRALELNAAMSRLSGERRFAEAIAPATEAVSIYREVYGVKHEDYAVCLSNLADVYHKVGDGRRAVPLFIEARAVFKEVLGIRHPHYVTSVALLAGAYHDLAEYDAAEPLLLEVVAIRKLTLGAKHPDYALSLNNLAALNIEMGAYQRAETRLTEACAIFKEVLGTKHPLHADCLANLASLYTDLGDCARAEPLALEALRIRSEVLGAKHPSYVVSLNVLGGIYRQLGSLAQAERYYRESVAVRKELFGTKHRSYATSLSNLAGVYKDMGDYARAEPLYRETIDIEADVLGGEHPSLAVSFNNLATLYSDMGDKKRAEILYLESIKIRKKALGLTHPAYATALSNLAQFYSDVGQGARAEPMFLEALRIRRETLGARHPDCAEILNNLGMLYISQADYARAEPHLVEAVAINKQALGTKHLLYAKNLNNLALLYTHLGDRARAEPLYVEALAINKLAVGTKHPEYAKSLCNLAESRTLGGDIAGVGPLYREALEISRESMEASALVQSERQQLATGNSLRGYLESYIALGLMSNTDAPDVFEQLLAWKGATLVRQRGMRLAADQPEVKELFVQLQQATARLSSLTRTEPGDEKEDAAWWERLAELTRTKEQLEAALSARSADYRKATKKVTLDELLAALPRDAVLVDFSEYMDIARPGGKTDKLMSEQRLVAFVVRHAAEETDRVRMVALGPAAPVGKAIDNWRATFGTDLNGRAAGTLLRATLWQPLLEHIADAKTVLVSTDGVLGSLPLGALPGKQPGTYLLEDHHIAVLPVPQLLPDLVTPDVGPQPANELLLLGGVDYDARPDVPVAAQQQQSRGVSYGRLPAAENRYEPLDGATAEIAAIEKLYGRLFTAKPDDPLALTRTQADDARFRTLAPRYKYLHLATHGFFAGKQYSSALDGQASKPQVRTFLTERDRAVVGYNPGLLSGLALTGANLEPSASGDDGILTAQEIGVMDLSGVDTVVLSACDTGLGATAGGEGLLGVQRAFQVAGARTTVASFWKVDDLVTRLFMERFYGNLWEKKMSRLDALREAQLWVLRNPKEVFSATTRGPGAAKQLPDDGNSTTAVPTNPTVTRTPVRFWGAFSLSGDWR